MGSPAANTRGSSKRKAGENTQSTPTESRLKKQSKAEDADLVSIVTTVPAELDHKEEPDYASVMKIYQDFSSECEECQHKITLRSAFLKIF